MNGLENNKKLRLKHAKDYWLPNSLCSVGVNDAMGSRSQENFLMLDDDTASNSQHFLAWKRNKLVRLN